MAFHRLTWRVGFPFVLFVLLASVALALFTRHQLAVAEDERFVRVAVTTGAYIDQASLPTTVGLARALERVTGHTVLFRHRDRFDPPPPQHLAALPLAALAADRQPVRHGEFLCIAVPIEGKDDLLLVREDHEQWFDPMLVQVLAAFLLLAVLTAWLVVRGLVRPLRSLARQLPQIETSGTLDVPETARQDEIGDLARAFVRTRQALHDEQSARERMEKLAVLGRMTAALAHEVQNPVAAIRMHAQLWRGAQDDGTAAVIEHEAARIESMLNQWLFLTRPEPPATAPVDIGALLAQLVATQKNQTDHAAVAVQLDAPAGLVASADRRRLEQVFRNLLTNALQAMPGGGTVSIRAARADDVLRVTFADDGPGFSPTALRRFAEFFFSEREGGMGIGLSVASEILKAHGGRLTTANRDGGGAVVTVELPFAAATPSPPKHPTTASA